LLLQSSALQFVNSRLSCVLLNVVVSLDYKTTEVRYVWSNAVSVTGTSLSRCVLFTWLVSCSDSIFTPCSVLPHTTRRRASCHGKTSVHHPVDICNYCPEGRWQNSNCWMFNWNMINARLISCTPEGTTLHLLDGHSEERPSSAQPYLGGCYRTGSE